MYKAWIDLFWGPGLGVLYVKDTQGRESRAWIVRDPEKSGIPEEEDGILVGSIPELEGGDAYSLPLDLSQDWEGEIEFVI